MSVQKFGVALASLALLFAASTMPSMADGLNRGICQPSQGSDINNQYTPGYENAVRNYNQPVDQANAQQLSQSWNMEQYNSYQDTQAMTRYNVNLMGYQQDLSEPFAEASGPAQGYQINATQSTMPSATMANVDVGSLVPFTMQCNYMSQPGYFRYLVFDQQGIWLTRQDAVAQVISHRPIGD